MSKPEADITDAVIVSETPKSKRTRKPSAKPATKTAAAKKAKPAKAASKAKPAAKAAKAEKAADADVDTSVKVSRTAPTFTAKKVKPGEPNAGPALEKAITVLGSRNALAKYLGLHPQNIGRVLRAHRVGWTETFPPKFVVKLAGVSGFKPGEIDPETFLPNWTVPRVSKAAALAEIGVVEA